MILGWRCLSCYSVYSVYSFTTRALCTGHYHLETHNCHLGNDVPNKVITDFNIFVGINITINNCQSTHTFIGDTATYHQTCSITTTWIQSRCSPFLVGSSPSKYTVVHSQFYLTFLTINHLLPEIIYIFLSIQFTPFLTL
jgi:hypothetical protein